MCSYFVSEDVLETFGCVLSRNGKRMHMGMQGRGGANCWFAETVVSLTGLRCWLHASH